MLAVLGGLRRGEILGLCWSDVDFDRECVIVRRSLTPVSGRVLVLGPTKTHQERRVDLGPFGLAALRQQSTQQAAQRRRREGVYSDRDLVFANALGRPLQVSTVHRWVKAAFERPGLPFTASVRLGRGSLRDIPNSFGSTERLLGRPRKENETHENPPHHNLTRFARVLLVGATALGAKSLVRTRSPVQFRMWAPRQVSRFNPHHSFSTRPTAACHSAPPPHNCESFLVWSLPLELSGP